MKNVRIALVMLMVASLSFAQDPQVAPAPNIVVKEPVFDFGEMENSLSVEHTYEILNDGNLSLEIKQTKTSCGCTVANISRKYYSSGRNRDLDGQAVIEKPSRLAGGKTSRSNPMIPDTPSMQLTLQGTAVASLTINPQRIFPVRTEVGFGGLPVYRHPFVEQTPDHGTHSESTQRNRRQSGNPQRGL